MLRLDSRVIINTTFVVIVINVIIKKGSGSLSDGHPLAVNLRVQQMCDGRFVIVSRTIDEEALLSGLVVFGGRGGGNSPFLTIADICCSELIHSQSRCVDQRNHGVAKREELRQIRLLLLVLMLLLGRRQVNLGGCGLEAREGTFRSTIRVPGKHDSALENGWRPYHAWRVTATTVRASHLMTERRTGLSKIVCSRKSISYESTKTPGIACVSPTPDHSSNSVDDSVNTTSASKRKRRENQSPHVGTISIMLKQTQDFQSTEFGRTGV